MAPIAPPVVALQLVQLEERPVAPSGEAVVLQRVLGGVLPGERRLQWGRRSAGRLVVRPVRQRVAVVQVAPEVTGGLHRLHDGDHAPRDTGPGRGRLISGAVRNQAPDEALGPRPGRPASPSSRSTA